ncbi:MAG: DNA-directed RNA polymerase I subunit rpa49 [Peltula sp. TS41687]|nr:MAG: DNA-directed RNA polymerase I subunit rpa49 [Peltula sp. TS41687]
MADLKRKKKHSSDDSRPRKKLATEASKTARPMVKFRVVADNSDDLKPVVASAPGLVVPTDITFKPYKKRLARPAASIRPQVSSTTSKSEFLLHSNTHPRVDYLGREEEGESTDGLLKHYVGVYDPKTGELQLIEARKIVLRGTVRARDEEDDDAEEQETPPQTATALRQELGRTFGTKKARKAIESLTENAVNSRADGPPDAAGAALLEAMNVSMAHTSSREQMQAAVDEAKPRPKANLQAEKPEEVYTVATLIGSDTMELLMVQEWLDAARALRPITTRSRYVGQRLQRIAADGNVQKLKVLRYLLLLLDFMSALKAKGKGGLKRLPDRQELRDATGVQDFLIDAVRKKFTDGPTISKWQMDNLTTHIAALTLLVDNFEVDTYDIREDLKLENKEMSQYYQEIGCKVSQPSDTDKKKYGIKSKVQASMHRIAKLKLPLEFPKAKFGKRRK